MSILDTLASLPQIDSLRIARDIIAELGARGFEIVEKEEDIYAKHKAELARREAMRPRKNGWVKEPDAPINYLGFLDD